MIQSSRSPLWVRFVHKVTGFKDLRSKLSHRANVARASALPDPLTELGKSLWFRDSPPAYFDLYSTVCGVRRDLKVNSGLPLLRILDQEVVMLFPGVV